MTTPTPTAQALTPDARARLERYQTDEITGALIYEFMAEREKNLENSQVLLNMASQERDHAAILARYTGHEARPDRAKIAWFTALTLVSGFTFATKLMEKDEALTAAEYQSLVDAAPEMRSLMEEEQRHEEALGQMLDEERLHYVGAMVLGLNDALVELTGAIAGLTFALANNRLVALAGIITGVAATLSMAASNYLAERADGKDDAVKSSLYTGVAYLVTVVLLIAPYLLYPVHLYLPALLTMLVIVVAIIFVFNYYVAVAKDQPFWPRFAEMAAISLGVAAISFLIGLAAKYLLGVEL